jgi:hypothetical protein
LIERNLGRGHDEDQISVDLGIKVKRERIEER